MIRAYAARMDFLKDHKVGILAICIASATLGALLERLGDGGTDPEQTVGTAVAVGLTPQPSTPVGSSAEKPTTPQTPASGIPGDGTYRIGQDIPPGTYRAVVKGGLCYYARLRGTSGSFSDIITNGTATSGPVVVTVANSDAAIEVRGCGAWSKIG